MCNSIAWKASAEAFSGGSFDGLRVVSAVKDVGRKRRFDVAAAPSDAFDEMVGDLEDFHDDMFEW